MRWNSCLDGRQAMTLAAANQEVYNLLRDGIQVEFDNAEGQPQKERVRLIDFNAPDSPSPNSGSKVS